MITNLLILIYLYLGCEWVQRYVLQKHPSFAIFVCNFILWPIYFSIFMLSYLKVKTNNTIKEKT